MELTDLLFKALGLSFVYLLVCMGRAFWYLGTHALYDRECDKRHDAIDRLEREVMAELVRCASLNPDAAAVLRAREAARRVPPSSPHYAAFRQLFCDFDVGGEPRFTANHPTGEQPCATAESS